MTSRLNGVEIKKFYGDLAADGEYCHLCHKTLPELMQLYKTDTPLRLHEIRYVRPLKRENFMLLCAGCNKKKKLSRVNILRRNPTPEHAISIERKPLFRRWLVGEILKPENNHHLEFDRVVKQGAYEIDVDIETIKRWLEPLLDHPTSPYVTRVDNYGKTNIWDTGDAPEEDEVI